MDNYTDNNYTIYADDVPWWNREAFLSTFYAFELALIVFGVCSNCLLLTIVVKFQDMKSSTNFFLVNLAVADILILILVQMPKSVTYFTNLDLLFLDYIFISTFVYEATIPISTFTLTLVTAERYYAISKPLKAAYTITKRRTLMAIGLIWIVSIALKIPTIFFHLSFFLGHAQSYYVAMDVVSVFLPLISIIVLNIFLCKQLHTTNQPGAIDKSTNLAVTQNRQVILMISIVTTVLFLCFLPNKIWYTLVLYVGFDIFTGSTIMIMSSLCEMLYTVNSVINPIVYGFVNTKFRRAMRKMLMPGRQRQ